MARTEIRPLQVDGGQTRIVPLKARAFLLTLDELVLADPLDVTRNREEVGSHAVEDGLPQGENLLIRSCGRRPRLLEGIHNEVEVDLLKLGRRVCAPSSGHFVVEVRVMGDIPGLLNRIVHHQ